MKTNRGHSFPPDPMSTRQPRAGEHPAQPPSGWQEHLLSALGSGGFQWLAEHPVLWRGERITLVTFGVLAAIEALIFQLMVWACFQYRGLPLEQADLLKMLSGAGAICLGAKLFHWLAIWRDLIRNPKKHLAETGFYLQGGILGGLVWALVAFRHGGTTTILTWMDAMCCAGLLGQVVGRLACLSYGCCFGKPCACGHGLVYQNMDSKVVRWRPDLRGVPLHPTQLYDGFASLLGFVIALFLLRGHPAPGWLTAFTLAWHGAARLGIEPYRADIHFSAGRNWTTGITAGILLVVGALLGVFIHGHGPEFAALRITAGPSASPGEISAVFAANAVLIFVVYGIHGPQLGRFPFSQAGGRLLAWARPPRPAARAG
jgi:prolipoprotein diacylglyceryltransferase